MTKDYASRSAEELLTELANAGRAPHPDLIRECLERPEELTPTFLTWLEAGGDETWEDGDPRWYQEIHAGHLLIAYREPAALPILAEIYRDEERENLVEWFSTELPAYGPLATQWAIDLLNDEQVYEYARSEVAGILSAIGWHFPSERERVLEALRAQLPALNEDGTLDLSPAARQHPEELWTWIVSALADLRDQETEPLVTALYENKLIDEWVIGDLEGYRGYFRPDAREPHVASYPLDILKTYQGLHREAQQEAKWWAEAEQRRVEEQRRAERAAEGLRPASTDVPADMSIFHEPEKPETYVRSEPKVGRNDPCPCGSGRKYKHCCWKKDHIR